MSETLYSEQLTNPDFLLWKQEIQTSLVEAMLQASGVEYVYGNTGNPVNAHGFVTGGNSGN